MSRADDCNTWLSNKQLQFQNTSIGTNKIAIVESLADHKKLYDAVQSFVTEIENLGPQESQHLRNTHRNLLDEIVKQSHCLETLLELQSMEDIFGKFTNDVIFKSVSLSDKLRRKADFIAPDIKDLSGASVYQNCIISLQNNWDWMSTLMKCTEIHLKDAADYHQCYHSLHEYSHWMPVDLEKVGELLNIVNIKTDIHGITIQRLLRGVKTASAIFIRWQDRMDNLLHRTRDLTPSHLRTSRITSPRPCFALATYSTKHVNLQLGEEVMLLDNSKIQMWKIQNLKGEIYEVPSILLKIAGPDEEFLNKSMGLMLKLLAGWTNMVKRYGKTIVLFLLFVIKIWSPQEELLLIDLPPQEKQEVKRLLDLVEKTFSHHWTAYPPYEELQRRMSHLRSLIHQAPNSNESNRKTGSLLIVQTQLLEELLFHYREFWKHWETYKILTECSKHPECLLSVSNWKQYHFLQLSDWLKTWQVSLDFDETDYDDYGRSLVEEQIQVEREKKLATTSQLFSSEQEENQTFTITGVTDPLSGEEISLDEAVIRGIINQTEGKYINKITGESIPILVAMNAGQIKVELVKVNKSQERVKDVGLVDIKMIKETRPYILKGVRDPHKHDVLSIDEAVKRGILNQKENSYKDIVTGNVLTLAEALDSGLILVDFLSDNDSHKEPLIESKTYLVNGVLDRKSQRLHTFSEALREGLINPDNGSYHDTLWGKDMYIGDAIRESFVKAIVVKDASAIDIDPSNKISVDEDKLQFFKKAILNFIKL